MNKAIVKCKVKNRDQLEERLSRLDLEFSPICWLHDRIYVPRGYRPGQNLPRLIMRTTMYAVDEPPRYTLILKRHIEDSGLDIVEETPVTDYIQTVNIISQLGFTQSGEVSRRRTELTLGERTVMYLDDLDSTGDTYAKLETTLTPEDSIPAVKQSLIHTFDTLNEHEIIEHSYVD